MYAQKIAIIFDHSSFSCSVGLENKLFLNRKITQLPTYKSPWYLIRLIGQPQVKFYAINMIKADYKTR